MPGGSLEGRAGVGEQFDLLVAVERHGDERRRNRAALGISTREHLAAVPPL